MSPILSNRERRERASRFGRWLIVLSATLLLIAAGVAAERHDCTRHTHDDSCALCAFSFSPAAPMAVVALVFAVYGLFSPPATDYQAERASFHSPLNSRAPPAA